MTSILNKVKTYFDIREQGATVKAATTPRRYIVPQYILLTLGIIVQPFLEVYMHTNKWSFDVHDFGGRCIFGLIIGLAIFPGVYKNAWDNTSPLFPQLCSIFVAGLGWQTLFATATHSM